LPDGIEAYCITGVTASAITIEKLTGTTIPAYEPLLLKKVGTVDFTAILTAKPVAPSSGYDAATGIVTATVSGATFYGNAADDAIYTVEGGFIHEGHDATGTASYMLRDGEFILVDQNQGLAAHRCLLNVSAGSNAARKLNIAIDDGDVMGITTTNYTNYTNSEGAWYSLDGRKLDGEPTKKGLYIQKGRKVVIK
jgi:hypothetical protein